MRVRRSSRGITMRAVERLGHPDGIERIDVQRFGQLAAAPANSLSTRTPSSSLRQATNSLATRFMPSRSGVTSMTSAARYKRRQLAGGSARIQVVDREPS